MNKQVYIAVDFDGTVVTHDYPLVGKDVPGAVEVLKDILAEGHKIILNTMRSDDKLQDAVNWFKERGIELYGVNENPSQKSWTKSLKVYANRYIDDAVCGCPLLFNSNDWLGDGYPVHNRPYVDWMVVRDILETEGFLTIKKEDGE